MKRSFFNIVFLCVCLLMISKSSAQIYTYNPEVEYINSGYKISKVAVSNYETVVTISYTNNKYTFGGWIRIPSATILIAPADFPTSYYSETKINLASLSGMSMEQCRYIAEKASGPGQYLIKHLGTDKLDVKYSISYGQTCSFELHFPPIPNQISKIAIVEMVPDGDVFGGIVINNKYPTIPTTDYTEITVKSEIDKQNDGIVGIYEAVNYNGYKLACIKNDGEYKLIYLSSTDNGINTAWKIGEVKAILRPTAQTFFFKADWYMANKSKNTNCYISFDGGTMKALIDGDESTYLKMYPAAGSSFHSGEWGGTGFALNNGYVVTNQHVIDGANTIEIYGVKGDFNTAYTATVVASDKNNDLALLKISDNRFTGFGTIPYKIKTTQSEVGESISVLGYPLTSTMGDEIKLTTGVISSKTGFQGDVSLYQISAAVQPGNSGGPLFDNYGNIIGIVSSKHTGAENVGYAVKATYLRNLIESCVSTSILPANNSLSGLTLPEKVKKSKNFIFMIRCK